MAKLFFPSFSTTDPHSSGTFSVLKRHGFWVSQDLTKTQLSANSELTRS